LLQEQVEALFNSPVWTAVFLFITAILLTVSELWSKKTRELDAMTVKDSLIIGAFQALSIFPGVSRSGATITGGLTQGFKRQSAAKFSFLMSIPVMLAAGLLSLVKLIKMDGVLDFLPILLLGFVIAGVVGYIAIKWFIGYLKEKSLLPFAVYCAVLAIAVIFVAYLR
jgi:undecaprenyl-diphosphatase